MNRFNKLDRTNCILFITVLNKIVLNKMFSPQDKKIADIIKITPFKRLVLNDPRLFFVL